MTSHAVTRSVQPQPEINLITFSGYERFDFSVSWINPEIRRKIHSNFNKTQEKANERVVATVGQNEKRNQG